MQKRHSVQIRVAQFWPHEGDVVFRQPRLLSGGMSKAVLVAQYLTITPNCSSD